MFRLFRFGRRDEKNETLEANRGRRVPTMLLAVAGLLVALGISFANPGSASADVAMGDCADGGNLWNCTAEVGPNDQGILWIKVYGKDDDGKKKFETVFSFPQCPKSADYTLDKNHEHLVEIERCGAGRNAQRTVFAVGELGDTSLRGTVSRTTVMDDCADGEELWICFFTTAHTSPGVKRILVYSQAEDGKWAEEQTFLFDDCPRVARYTLDKAHEHRVRVELCGDGRASRPLYWIMDEDGKSEYRGYQVSQATPVRFIDVPEDSTFYAYVNILSADGIISGYVCGAPGESCPGNYFRPGANVTRGQVAKMIANAAGYEDEVPQDQQTFADVPVGSVFWQFIERISSRGIINGYTCGGPGEPCDGMERPYFRPGRDVTRGQLAKMATLASGFSEQPQDRQTFADVPVGSVFHTYIEEAAGRGIINGYTCGGSGEPCDGMERPYFRPNSPSTRGQTSKIIAGTFFSDLSLPLPALTVDNDKDDVETITENPNIPPAESYGVSLDSDGDIDEVVLGLGDGATVAGTGNVDNDKDDREIIVNDPSIFPNQSYGIDLDGDGDWDVILTGTKSGGTTTGTGNVDNDPNDTEVIVTDPNIFPNQSYGLDLDGDGDHDVIVVGTKGEVPASVQGSGNTDADPNENEVNVSDPNLTPNQGYGLDLDGDGDYDLNVTGTAGANQPGEPGKAGNR